MSNKTTTQKNQDNELSGTEELSTQQTNPRRSNKEKKEFVLGFDMSVFSFHYVMFMLSIFRYSESSMILIF